MIVISDTSVFTNLAAIGHFHLLQQLYDRIFIPTAVYQELTVDPPVPIFRDGFYPGEPATDDVME